MKRHLLATSALVAAGMLAAGPVSAAEKIKLSVGGYMEQWIGFADQDGSFESAKGSDYVTVDVQSDTELHFKGSTKLDNGLTVGVRVEIEGVTSGDQIDETFLFVKGSFGTVHLGDDDAAAYTMGYHAPEAGIGNGGDPDNWVVKPSAVTRAVTVNVGMDSTANGGTDSTGIIYFSPRIEGFQVGASYSADQANDSVQGISAIDKKAEDHERVSLGANYKGKFDNVSLKLSAGLIKTSKTDGSTGQDDESWGVGGQVSFSGFTIGGAWIDMDGDDSTTASLNGELYDVGVLYKTGAYKVSLNYRHGEHQGAAAAGDDEESTLTLSGAYNMGPGVDWRTSLLFADWEDEGTAKADSNEGWALVTGFKVSF